MERTDLILTDEARVARILLSPKEVSLNQYHTHVVENVVCLTGEIGIKTSSCNQVTTLLPGQIYDISPKERHYPG